MDEENRKKLNRVHQVLEAAANLAKGVAINNALNGIRIHPGYSEPGYETDLVVATGNWVNVTHYNPTTKEQEIDSTLPIRIQKCFEKLGVPCEWKDMWRPCVECGRLVATTSSELSWTPNFVGHGDGLICKNCFCEDPGDILSFYERKNFDLITFFEVPDFSEYGFVKYKEMVNPMPEEYVGVQQELRDKRVKAWFIHTHATNSFVEKDVQTRTVWVSQYEGL